MTTTREKASILDLDKGSASKIESGSLLQSNVDVKRVRDELSELGYSIAGNVIAHAVVDELREFWLERICRRDNNTEVVWQPYLGERNSFGFSRDDRQHMFRAVDLPWNEPIHAATRALCNELNLIRNTICGLEPDYNLKYRTDRYGMYVSATYYPLSGGYLREHVDDYDDASLVHFIVPLTFKGQEYDRGGLFLIDKNGLRIDVDDSMKPGSVLFFSGQRPHGVESPASDREHATGRLQIFGVPVHFLSPAETDRMVAEIPMVRYAKAKLRRWIPVSRYRRRNSMI